MKDLTTNSYSLFSLNYKNDSVVQNYFGSFLEQLYFMYVCFT